MWLCPVTMAGGDREEELGEGGPALDDEGATCVHQESEAGASGHSIPPSVGIGPDTWRIGSQHVAAERVEPAFLHSLRKT